jgi:50S ribosomal protein L16 3-hydroxylase
MKPYLLINTGPVMIHFQEVDLKEFLTEYWQKKPLVIRNAIPQFINPLPPDELAGLALEEDIESRIVFETPNKSPQWQLKRGPFQEDDFNKLPNTHWTLLVQGVDRIVPEVYRLLDHFDFIPQWRVDDVMISYATRYGSVGPHYDHYDVFLYQGLGRREWSLTSQHCTPENYIQDLELRIMDNFTTEQRFVLEEGDMLYLPPHIGHYGIALSDECMTYSFGYRSYSGQEMLDSFADYLAEKKSIQTLYQDPDWSTLNSSSELSNSAWNKAQQLLVALINNDKVMQPWFSRFATQLDRSAELLLPEPLEEEELDEQRFLNELDECVEIIRDPCCRFAYYPTPASDTFTLFINSEEWCIEQVSPNLVRLLCDHRFIPPTAIKPYLSHLPNRLFLLELWKRQWLRSND